MKSARFMTATLLCLSCTCAFAQNYPSRPARMVVPWTAGGTADQIGRAHV